MFATHITCAPTFNFIVLSQIRLFDRYSSSNLISLSVYTPFLSGSVLNFTTYSRSSPFNSFISLLFITSTRFFVGNNLVFTGETPVHPSIAEVFLSSAEETPVHPSIAEVFLSSAEETPVHPSIAEVFLSSAEETPVHPSIAEVFGSSAGIVTTRL